MRSATGCADRDDLSDTGAGSADSVIVTTARKIRQPFPAVDVPSQMKSSIEIGNARSRITGLDRETFRLLGYELSYQIGEPGVRRYLSRSGSVETSFWDGYKRLLSKSGVFPSGLIPRVLRLLGKWGIPKPALTDLRDRPPRSDPRWEWPEGIELRDYQIAAVGSAEAAGRGVIDSPPRSGKTFMMAELIRRLSVKTVITAPTEAIAAQTHDRLKELFVGHADDFYLLTGGPPKTRKAIIRAGRALVFSATAATAAGMAQPWWDQIRCLIVDERHHQAAKTYQDISDLAVNAYYRFGFTGTNYRSHEGESIALEACLGRTVASYSISEMTEREVLVPGRVEFLPIDYRGVRSKKFDVAYRQGIVRSDLRNAVIARTAKRYQAEGRKVLILVHYIKHGQSLEAMIPGSQFVQGGNTVEVRQAVSDLDSGEICCLIGSPVVGEGLDCPAADCLLYAKGYKARVTHTQDVFRVLTGGAKKNPAIIVDFADRHNPTLLDHSVDRLRNYISLGLDVSVADTLDCESELF